MSCQPHAYLPYLQTVCLGQHHVYVLPTVCLGQRHLYLTFRRLYAPGEQADVDFAQPPQSHIFPSGVYGRHGLKVTVLFLPRQQSFPALPCALARQAPQGVGGGAWGQGGGASLRAAQPEESAGDAGRWKRQGARSKLSG